VQNSLARGSACDKSVSKTADEGVINSLLGHASLNISDMIGELRGKVSHAPIERLERARIVKRGGDAKRDRLYCATALPEILEEPARLTPTANR